MKFSPRHDDLRIRIIYASLIVAAFVMMSFGTGIVRVVLMSLSVICLAAGLFLFIKFDMTTYTYIVLENDKRLDFYVDKMVGKRSAYACYYPLSDALTLEKYEKGVKKAIRQKYGKVFFYNYSHNCFCPGKYALVFQNDGYCDAIICQLDITSAEYLRRAIGLGKEEQAE